MADQVTPPTHKKVGLEWISNYPDPYVDLPHSGENAQGFLNRLMPVGSRPADFGFDHGNAAAHGLDLEQDATSSSALPADSATADPGNDLLNAEAVDLLYFSGHGTYDRLFFAGSSLDDSEVWNTEMKLGQGPERTLKWFIADACKVLNTMYNDADSGKDVRRRWKKIFYGLRYLFGFHSDCSDMHNRGEKFADHINLDDTIRHAWELACQESENDLYIPWAYLWAGGPQSSIRNEKWSDLTFGPFENLPDPLDPGGPPVPTYTYVRNILPSEPA